MKFLAVFALAVACASADVSHVVARAAGDADAVVVKADSEVNPDGFQYVYETSNGIYASSSGVVVNPNSENPSQEVKGEYRYVGDDGVTYTVTYVADGNGFQPQGAHLPVAPPVPELIQRSLEYIAAHPPAEEKYAAAARVSQPAAPAYKPPSVPAYRPPVQAFNKPFGKRF